MTSTYASATRPRWRPGASYTRNPTITLPAVPGRLVLPAVRRRRLRTTRPRPTRTTTSAPSPITLTPADVDLVVTGATAPASASPGAIDISWTVRTRAPTRPAATGPITSICPRTRQYDFSDSYVASATAPAPGRSTAGAATPEPQPRTCRAWPRAITTCCSSRTVQLRQPRPTRTTTSAPCRSRSRSRSVDLVVTAADAPATAEAGGTANVSWTVTNQGTDPATARNWYDYVYLSTDDKLRLLRRLRDSVRTSTTPLRWRPGASYTRNQTITLPSVPAGKYYLLFVTDRRATTSPRPTRPTTSAPCRSRCSPPERASPVDLELENASAPDSASAGRYISVTLGRLQRGDGRGERELARRRLPLDRRRPSTRRPTRRWRRSRSPRRARCRTAGAISSRWTSSCRARRRRAIITCSS